MALKLTRRGLPLLGLGALALLAGLWAGLLRLGWPLPAVGPGLAAAHGPLMVGGFLGTVVALERAVALGRTWGFAAPALGGLGGMLLVAALPGAPASALLTLSSLLLLLIFLRLFQRRPEWPAGLLALGAGLWLGGNILWLSGSPLPVVVPWWAGFLVLTIAGERLELAQLLFPPRVQAGLVGTSGVVALGLALSLVAFEAGVRVAGLGLLALALWLLRFDIARRTLRRTGLPRFTAWCLLLGYLWLGLSGLLWLVGAEQLHGGLFYDAMLHTIFVGFVFSMLFGHAPTIIPAVSGVMVAYQPRFYLHLALLHASLALRIVGDLAAEPELRRWGGLLNEAAILLFLLFTVLAARQAGHGPLARG